MSDDLNGGLGSQMDMTGGNTGSDQGQAGPSQADLGQSSGGEPIAGQSSAGGALGQQSPSFRDMTTAAQGGVPQSTTAPVEPQGQAQAQQAAAIIAAIKQRGIDPSVYGIADDNAAVDTFARILQAWPQLYQLAQIGQAVVPHLDKVREVLSGGNTGAQAAGVQGGAPAVGAPQPQPVEPQNDYWPKPPEWNPEWARYLTVGVDGQVRAVNPLYEKYAEAYHAREKWAEQNLDRLLHDPVGVVLNAPQFKETIQQVLQEEFDRRNERSTIEGIIRENAEHFFVRGADGAPVIDPITNQPVLTPQGQFVQTFLQWAVSADVKSLLPIALTLGNLLAGGGGAQAANQSLPAQQQQVATPPVTQQPPSSPAQPAPALQRRQSARSAGGEGSQPRGGVGTTKSFRQVLSEQARAAGVQF